MAKKTKSTKEIEVIEIENVPDPIRISKRTGKPVRELTELQKETLAKGRLLAVAKRKELLVGVDLEKRAEAIKKGKDELKKARDLKQQEKLQNQKKMYEDATNEEDTKTSEQPTKQEPLNTPIKQKKIKKKIIKYVSESDSSSSDEEEIIVKKRKEKVKENKEENYKLEKNIHILTLKDNLQNEQKNNIAALLQPSYH